LCAELLAGAYVAPTSSETLRAAMLRGEPVMTVHVGPAPASAPEAHPGPGAAKVSSAPDPRMNGRDIYMMAIQMPNLTSYSGSWLLWYADRTAREAGLAPLSPPVAHRKVDPKYTPAAVQDRAEGRVQLACVIDKEGNVSGIELLRGADARLNQSAQEALSKWQFYPATRDGAPVDVDVVVEIPFTLAPPPPRR
jgi:TonB family protein